MPTPREKTSIVNAPVLFRLPHVHGKVLAKGPVAQGGQNSGYQSGSTNRVSGGHDASAGGSPSGAAWSGQAKQAGFQSEPKPEPKEFRVDASRVAVSQSSVSSSSPDTATAARVDSFMERWAMEIKRSVILLAAIAILWGTWTISQKPAVVPDDSNLAKTSEDKSSGKQSAHEGLVNATAERLQKLSSQTQVASIVEPTSKGEKGATAGFVPVTEPQSSFDQPNLQKPEEISGKETKGDIAADFSPTWIESLEPPANDSFYSDFESDNSELSVAQKPSLASPSTELPSGQSTEPSGGPNQPTTSSNGDSSATSATNFVPSATPEMPGFDPNNSQSAEGVLPINRPVFSATPNGVSDWSRYLPGNSGNASSVRAVSATQAVGAKDQQSSPNGKQAIYLDENDDDTADVGVAPFYR